MQDSSNFKFPFGPSSMSGRRDSNHFECRSPTFLYLDRLLAPFELPHDARILPVTLLDLLEGIDVVIPRWNPFDLERAGSVRKRKLVIDAEFQCAVRDHHDRCSTEGLSGSVDHATTERAGIRTDDDYQFLR